MSQIIRIYDIEELLLIHHLSIYHVENIRHDNHKCGCFHCLKMFDSSLITKWTDKNTTALCPLCDIDSVLYDNETYPMTALLLTQMNKRYFDYR